jgi:hypothetical protein
VDLPQRHAPRALQFVGIGAGIEMGIVRHARRLFLMRPSPLILIRMRSRSKPAQTGRGPVCSPQAGSPQ